VVNVDIRGFSAFSKEVDSTDVAMYVKRVYTRIIDEYFPGASYFKPTGDGLIVIIPYTESDIPQVAEGTVSNCIRLVRDFPSLLSGDPIINYRTPEKIGIGVARGVACRLVSGEVTLDFSGRFLNMASRLMDLARPAGVVIDATFGVDLLSPETVAEFERGEVYLKGIADRSPVKILYSKGLTIIPEVNKYPLDDLRWEVAKQSMTLAKMSRLESYMFPLARKPVDSSKVQVQVIYPKVTKGRKEEGVAVYQPVQAKYQEDAGRPIVLVSFPEIVETITKQGVKRTWEVIVEIRYPV